MNLLLISLVLLAVSGFGSSLLASKPSLSRSVGVAGAALAGLLTFFGSAHAFYDLWHYTAPVQFRANWNVPFGSFFLEIDALSAFFLFVLGLMTSITVLFLHDYIANVLERSGKTTGAFFFFLNFFIAGMMLVVLARNGVLFLIAWEVMSLAAYFLVITDDDQESVRDAGWNYLVAAHLGAAFLLVLFILLGRGSGTLDFPDASAAGQLAGIANVIFLLALVGFGTKAGFVPFHVWLPDTYQAAPSPISGLMSGVMSKMGIYGLLRVLSLLPTPPLWWGMTLIGIGMISGLFGILMANAQKDFKRLVAYSSIENLGIISMGIGAGMLGLSMNKPALAFLGFAGAILHVLNHAVMKTLLFLVAGTVRHATNTGIIDKLGGLYKQMPTVGLACLVGIVAISGLPPLNGFYGEFLIFLGVYQEALTLPTVAAIPALMVISSLALIGGLTLAGFSKFFGIAFLGSARSPEAENIVKPSRFMIFPLVILAATCVTIAILAPFFIPLFAPVVAIPTRVSPTIVAEVFAENTASWEMVSIMSGVFVAILGGLILLRRRLLKDRDVHGAGTWGCGYLAPTTRMQYTSSSYSQPIVDLAGVFLGHQKQLPVINEYFPRNSLKMKTETEDPLMEHGYVPFYAGARGLLARLRWFHHGRLHIYVLYIAVTLLVLLFRYLGPSA
ncbi:MAG: hydrogenase [Planctomycetes bacterium]|nr:hydrogenase [Planctomycetota bacterium]